MCVTRLCDTTASEAKEDVDVKEAVQGIVCFQNAQNEKQSHLTSQMEKSVLITN